MKIYFLKFLAKSKIKIKLETEKFKVWNLKKRFKNLNINFELFNVSLIFGKF